MNKRKLYESIMKNVAIQVKKALNESANNIIEKADELNDILQNEFRKAKRDIETCESTFHYGIKADMIDKGYDIVSATDNNCYFYSKSGLFYFNAFESHTDGNWHMNNNIRVKCKNFSVEKVYSYPYKRKEYEFETRVDQFKEKYIEACESIDDIVEIESYRKESEKTVEYSKYDVYSYVTYNWGGGSYEVVASFDNFEDAKEKAYDLALRKIERGKETNLRRYYYNKPVDSTKSHSDSVVCYTYYSYGETTYYVYVKGKN